VENNIKEKIELLKNLNTDNSRFILKIIESFEKHKIEIEEQKIKSSIIINSIENLNKVNYIDLDKLWIKPYLYTNMRLKFDEIINQFNKISYEDFSNNPKKICNTLVNIKISKNFEMPNDHIDIVDYIKNINNNYTHFKNEDIIFYAKNIDEESLFKEEQLKKAFEIIKIKDKNMQASAIYDEIYNYLDRDFISNKYCDFINDKCVAQRHFTFYPINRKDGCCFMQISKCKNLREHGACTVKCLACRLFSCPYLSKKGVGYWASDFILLKAFLNKNQRKHLVFDFYTDKDIVLEALLKEKS